MIDKFKFALRHLTITHLKLSYISISAKFIKDICYIDIYYRYIDRQIDR